MKVRPILNKFLANTIAPTHKSRQQALATAIESAMNGNSLTVASLGRGIK